MSGLDAWRGFRYQSLTLVRRLLDDLERSRAAQLEGAAPSGTARYRLERSLDEQGPDWDVIEYRDGRVILDECKSGETLTPDDRRALWQRVRRTVEANPHAEISVRLTVSESTANRDHWVGWDADLRSSAPAAGVLPDRVTTREAAFAEARYWLTTTEERIDVERLLTTFTVAVLPARAQLEASIIATLSGLSGADLATVLARWMEGLTTAVATDGTRELDAASFVAELGLASRLFQIEPAVLDAWTLMRGGAVAAASSMHVGPLLERSWRDIQPEVAARLDECASSRALLLVGHGGLGKTTLLEQLAREHGGDDVVVWIDDTMPDRHLASAVLLGGWLAEHRRARLLVLVDQLDEMDRASRDARLEAASSAVRASPRATVIATARDATATLVPGNWERVALGDWPVELVRRIVAQSIPEQLCELLRTPLLLALWLDLRATASDAIAVADRASVIGEWLARRLLPSADVRSAGRLSVLTDCAAQALAGRHTWELHGADMGSVRELLDLGMLRGEAGRYRFRHTLLRDAAIVLVWGRDGVDGLVGRLSLGDLSYAVMFDGLRSAFDAAFSPVGMRPVGVTFSWQELLSASRNARLPTTAVIAQAAVPDASAVDVLESVPLDELLDEASEARDTAWVRRLVSMPVKPRPSFIRRASAGSQLLPLYKWCGHHEPDVELSREVARRIRGWLRPGDRGLLPNTWQLPRGVAEMLPDAETVRWLQALDGKPSLFTFEFRKLASASSELPLDALADAFLSSLDPDDPDDGLAELVPVNGEAGLLSTQPRAGFRILFEMSARAVDAKGDGAIVDDRWTCQAQEWDYTWWHAAWETFARSCRADEPLATIAVEECARSRSTAARLIIVRLLEGTDREHVLAPLLGGRTVAGVREELQRSIPPAPPKRRVSSGFDETYAPLDLSEPLRRLFDLGDESHPGSIANVVGDLVVRDGREPQRDGLVNLLASWSNDASIEVQRGRRIFIEGCMEAASRVPAGQLDLEGYAAVSRALWEAWRHIDGQAKHLGFQPEIGWRLSSVPPSARIVLEKALAPLIDAILVDGDGEDLRGLDMDSYWDLLDRQTVARIVAELIRRVTDGVPAARSRVRAFEIAVQRFIDGMLGSGVLDSAQVDSLLSLVHRNRWLLDTPRLHRHLIERARELRRS